MSIYVFSGTKCCNYSYMSVVTMCYGTIKLKSGIYSVASPLFEVLKEKRILKI